MTYEIIDCDDDFMRLPVAPAQVWVIASLEMCVRNRGTDYLLLTYPSYPLNGASNPNGHDEGYWAIPFVAFPVPISYSAPTTAGSLRSLAGTIGMPVLKEAVSQLAYQMGLQDTIFDYRGEFFELKNSPRTPELVKAYKVVRFGLTSLASVSVRNLADPDVRYGYAYLPLSNYEVATKVKHSPAHHRTERWYLGKPLMSDIDYILSDQGRRRSIATTSIDIDDQVFFRRETGLLLAADLSGYGAALRYVHENMRSFREDPTAIQDSFRRAVSESFERMLTRLGATQVQLAGDGFVAALPKRVTQDLQHAVVEVLSEWRLVVDDVASLNAAIRDPKFQVGSRIALHLGDYSYGRVGGAGSFSAAFDGAAIIEVVRLEQGLGAAMKRPKDGLETVEPLPQKGNCVAISQDLEQSLECCSELEDSSFTLLGHYRLESKESTATALVGELNSDES
ncbi:hypothetical protein ACFQ05_06675 [Amycolatopsis umgeniensis]|uniref:Guanylate cyclase domain-containing protein n=1 Tax=Amycolatopsis umgeniensis TaxID=336628 RepID=A0A841AYM5_9PSEU|nr:hypothetical protein [Amycolatopsis umgeniensis]MBB5852966.1 hypothetical protein [Amycolatopsis umgeniensis]